MTSSTSDKNIRLPSSFLYPIQSALTQIQHLVCNASEASYLNYTWVSTWREIKKNCTIFSDWRFYLFDARWKANPDLLESLVVISEAKSNKSWWLLFTLPIAMIIIQVKKVVFLGSWFWPDCSIVASTKDKLDFVFSLLALWLLWLLTTAALTLLLHSARTISWGYSGYSCSTTLTTLQTCFKAKFVAFNKKTLSHALKKVWWAADDIL